MSEDSHDVHSEPVVPQEAGELEAAERASPTEPSQELHQSRSNVSAAAPSEVSQATAQPVEGHEDVSPSQRTPPQEQEVTPPEGSAPIAMPGPRPLPSFISSADESMITRTTAKEGGSSSDPGAATGSSYGTVTTFGFNPAHGLGGAHDEHLPGQGGGWRPA